ncbi:ThuA domain-containing protein [Blastopirellula sp. JC732]|uniref:ThuA domain-containing protein n=1 Tax=Blastopirellula sediminis TaxID=2894196 RepID=A0A9X1MN12_9BACT|nr:PVC-type heme-binding CxxCH protein [Blastopirellula sediminis]MCC9606544.1 ThuA domain-containing protein [Blastopirellula sediminis]MCC9630158.1 ThuA domain-containing protein [Blastopirellula sediminis]
MIRLLAASLLFLSLLSPLARAADDSPIRILFLGDQGHHRPADRAAQMIPAMKERGINIEYTEDVNALNKERLSRYDGLMIYANIEEISPDQEAALLDYVAKGGALIPLHCATYCFLNSPAYVDLVGGQFQKHGGEVFSTVIAEPNHPIMKGFHGFQSWDETYIHHRHNEQNRTVLEYRVKGGQADGKTQEPWTWIRTQGAGRVFYTAWGHDARTWGNPGFLNLVERGVRWATKHDPSVVPDFYDTSRFDPPQMTMVPADAAKFDYIDVGAKIPNYTPSDTWGVQADPLTKMQLPLPAKDSMTHMINPVDFSIELYAADPELGGKPIGMNWDEQGRLWVCETLDYPNELQPNNRGRDRIRICEDTDGDGKADKYTIFAENLSIPTSILPYRGGAIVQNGTETLFLKDTNGDGKADVRKPIITNWTLGDTHGGVSNLHYGLDNWIWGMQGYNDSAPVINGQKQPNFRMGFFRFRLDDQDPPNVTDLEFIRSTDNNTWGLGISEEGIIFGSTANRNPSVYMPIANRYYEQVRGWGPSRLGTIADTYLFKPITDKIRQVDQHGGYTAGAGHDLYTARVYPEQWWNKTAFVCGPTGKLIGTFVMTPDGSDFHSTSPLNLVASDDEWTAPIVAQVGPDGNVWFLDWYNYIVQHNPTPHGFKTGKGAAYESDLRDKKHGRVYRVAYDKADKDANPAINLKDADASVLLAGLKHPNMQWRLHAQRLLIDRAQRDVVPQLIQMTLDPETDAIGLNVGAIHALWTLEGLGVLADPSQTAAQNAVVKALKHRSPGVRRNALAVLPPTDASTAAILASGTLNDADAQVRLAALLALSDMPSNSEAGAALAKLATDAKLMSDRWLPDALTSAAARHAVGFLPQIAANDQLPGDKAIGITTIVSEHLSRGKLTAAQLDTLLAGLKDADESILSAVIGGLNKGWPRDYKIDASPATTAAAGAVVEKAPISAKAALIRLAGNWNGVDLQSYADKVADQLLSVVEDEDASEADRIAAARQAVEFMADDMRPVDVILEVVGPHATPKLNEGLLSALSASTADATGEALAEAASTMTPAMRDAAIRVLLSRAATTSDLVNALEAGDLAFNDLKLDQRQALADHPDAKIRERARKLLAMGGGLPNADREAVLHDLLAIAEIKGDAKHGLELFKKHCSKCHKHSGEGSEVGPDLTGMAVHPKAELLTNIIDPSRSVEGNFRTYTVMTIDGKLLTGMLAGESRTAIEIIDAEAKKHQLAREDIEELVSSRKSLMPDGFEKQMTRQELTDLLEFLTSKGKFVPLPLDRVATITSNKGMFYSTDNPTETLRLSDWSPKTVEGVPFVPVNPTGDKPNVVMLKSKNAPVPSTMPNSVTLPLHAPAKAIHLLSGISGWGAPYDGTKTTAMIVRIHYADGKTEDVELKNGLHFADYIRRVEVPDSKFAFSFEGGQQIRYIKVEPKRTAEIAEIELVKGPHPSAPIVMAITAEQPDVKAE